MKSFIFQTHCTIFLSGNNKFSYIFSYKRQFNLRQCYTLFSLLFDSGCWQPVFSSGRRPEWAGLRSQKGTDSSNFLLMRHQFLFLYFYPEQIPGRFVVFFHVVFLPSVFFDFAPHGSALFWEAGSGYALERKAGSGSTSDGKSGTDLDPR
jgi:hypothetical protein